MSNLDDDEEFFADIYGEDTKQEEKPAEQSQPQPAPAVKTDESAVNVQPEQPVNEQNEQPSVSTVPPVQEMPAPLPQMSSFGAPGFNEPPKLDGRGFNTGNIYIPPKDEGKMFIGGLNWETTDESMKNYFSQFGEVLECSVMRDNQTGRSRGFGFLTFADAECVNRVVNQAEHFLDGKIIDPKRAIPREEQNKTAKIFVGGVGTDVTDKDFKEFFDQYGVVIDAQLMIDKDTGRPRGFGFVTFDSDQAVEKIVSEKFLILKNKPIEVKRAEPRTKGEQLRESERRAGLPAASSGYGGDSAAYMNGMNPQMMTQYYQRWQAYVQQVQQMMAANGGGGNPQQMMQMMMQQQQMQQQQFGGAGAPPRPYEPVDGDEDSNSVGEPRNPDNDNEGAPYQPEDDGDASRDRERDYRRHDRRRDRDYDDDRGGYRDRQRGRYRGRGRGSGSGGDDDQDSRRSRSPPANAPTGPRSGGSYRGHRRGGGGGNRNFNRNGSGGYHPYR